MNIFDDLGDPLGPPGPDALGRVLARARRRRRARRGAAAAIGVGAVIAIAIGANTLGSDSRAVRVAGTSTTVPASTSTSTAPASTSTTTSPTTTSTSTPGGNGSWVDGRITLTPTALGNVRVGMLVAQAEAAAGITFDGSGDGAYYPRGLPAGYPHLFVHVGVGVDTPVVCVGAEITETAQTPQAVVTPEGFRLGDSVQQLLRIYGNRAHYLPAPSGGISPRAGYVVSEPSGNLAFSVDTTHTRITGVKGGGTDLTPSSCNG